MAFRCLRLIKTIRIGSANNFYMNDNILPCNFKSSYAVTAKNKVNMNKEFRNENTVTYLEDPDTFGTLSRKTINEYNVQDEGDIKEQKYQQELPLKSQQLTTRQYANLIKQYLKQKRLKEAIDVLEVRMLQEDRVKPENYIYNILIGACADVGFTKKAFKLYNDMKKRALKPTGDTYTCLFTACLNSPWITDGFNKARHLRELMVEKGIEPNLTIYNVMIKTFGRCGDLPTAFKLVDEMISKKIKIRVHTFNHLLHACISDKDNGLRHALVVWRKMLRMREKPNIYSFNLMLKCIKDCNLGSKEDINELICILEENIMLNVTNVKKPLQIAAALDVTPLPLVQQSINRSVINKEVLESNHDVGADDKTFSNIDNSSKDTLGKKLIVKSISNTNDLPDFGHSEKLINSPFSDIDCKSKNNVEGFNDEKKEPKEFEICDKLSVINEAGENHDNISMELIDIKKELPQKNTKRTVPNLLSKSLQMDQVFALQDIHTIQDKFAVVGGQDDFLKEMEVYSVKPNIKIFTQMLPLIDNSTEAEMKLIEAMELAKVKADIDFYNMLIRKRCLRMDYDKAIEVKDMITKERKKRNPLKKRLRLKENIMTYGVLALTCRSKESAEKLLNEMKEKQLKVNIQILGTLLKNGIVNTQFEYVKYIMNVVKEEEVVVNDIFIKHLEKFNDTCATIMKQNEDKGKENRGFNISYQHFLNVYKRWLKEINAEEALKTEHPWQQFREPYPETLQRQPNRIIIQPKKFYKRNRKFVMYAPQIK